MAKQLKPDTVAGGLVGLKAACVPSCSLNVAFSLDLSTSSYGEGLHHCVQTCLTVSFAVMKHRDHKKKKKNPGRNVYLSLQLSGHTPTLRDIRAIIQTGQEPGGRNRGREGSWLTGLLPMACHPGPPAQGGHLQ